MSIKPFRHSSAKIGRRSATHVVRLLSPSGTYPDKTVATSTSLLFISKEICFSVTEYDPTEKNDAEYYSEVDWLTLNEIRFYSSILLSTDREVAYTAFYPLRYPSHVSLNLNRPLTSQRVQREIRTWLIAYLMREENSLPLGRGTNLPPAVGGPNYDFRDSRRDTRLQERLYSQIDTRDHLMMRGLSTLLRSIMIGQHFQFTEEAIHAAFIAMDASFSLIRRRLSNRGQKNVSSVDAAKYLAAVFYEEIIEMRYFEEFYDNRIMSIHPQSRFGTIAHPPLMVDDFYHLRDSMLGIYAYFNSGHVSNEIVEFAVSRNSLEDYRLYGHTMRLRYMRKAKFDRQKIRQSSMLYSTGFEQ